MKDGLTRRIFAAVLALALAMPASAALATERGAALSASGSDTTVMRDARVASARQGERLLLSGASFRFNERVGLWVTLPDGSVRGLDRDRIRANSNGDFAHTVALDGTLPTGLHHFTARGKTSGRGAIVAVEIRPGGGPGAAPGMEMRAVPERAPQLASVELYASRFKPRENVTLWTTRPDGAVSQLAVRRADAQGRIALDLKLPATMPIGRHMLSARGHSSGKKAVAPFELLQGNGLQPTPSIVAHIGAFQQRTTVEISGRDFKRNESVSLWLTKPNGAVIALGERRANASGSLTTTLRLGESLPVGTYYLSYRANTSKALKVFTLNVEHGPRATGQ